MNPICYLDVDGVLYYYPKNKEFDSEPVFAGLRPYIMGLLQTLHNFGYEVRFLSFNPEGGQAILNALFESGYFPIKWIKGDDSEEIYYEMERDIPSCLHKDAYFNGGERDLKTSYIDFSRDFIWIEDGILQQEEEVLKQKKVLNSYCYVDPKKIDALLDVISWIKNHSITIKYLDPSIVTTEQKVKK